MLKQFGAQSDAHEVLPNTVVQIVSNPPLFVRTDLDHLTLEPGALGDLLLKQRGLLLPQLLEFIAMLLGLELCLFSSSDVHADSEKSHRLPLFVYLHTPTRCDPAHTAVRKGNPILCLVIFAIFDRILDCVSNLIAIIYM